MTFHPDRSVLRQGRALLIQRKPDNEASPLNEAQGRLQPPAGASRASVPLAQRGAWSQGQLGIAAPSMGTARLLAASTSSCLHTSSPYCPSPSRRPRHSATSGADPACPCCGQQWREAAAWK